MIKRLVVSEGREELAVEGNDLLLNSERGAAGRGGGEQGGGSCR